jgi:trans-aconitate methyltransferase
MSESTCWNPESYAKNARFVADLGEPLLELLNPKPGDVVLDLGCGDGALTEKIAACGCVVYGVDASFSQIEAARKKGLQALVMDGQELCFKSGFDAVFSNAALHWMKQAEKVAAGVWRSLKPGGRFVSEFGGKGNVATIRSALHANLHRRGIDPLTVDPWYYPSPDDYGRLLAKSAFAVEYIEIIPRPTPLPGDILDWLEIFGQPFTKAVPGGERRSFLEEVRNELELRLRGLDGTWFADYVRLRFKAIKMNGAST